MSWYRTRSEEGVTIVEAAFALPVLFLFVFGLIDLGMWTFNSNQATNAARDGARVGILDFSDGSDGQHADGGPPDWQVANAGGSDQWRAIVDAVDGRLEGRKAKRVVVTCIGPDGIDADAEPDDLASCGDVNPLRIDQYKIRVEVTWDWDLLTPVAGILGIAQGEASGSATMQLVGRPLPGDGYTPPVSEESPDDGEEESEEPSVDCVVHSLAAPVSVSRKNINGEGTDQLAVAVPITFTTNGSPKCGALTIELASSMGKTVTVVCGCDLDPPEVGKYAWSYDGSDNIWKPGTSAGSVRLLDTDGVELKSTTFSVL